MFFRNSWGRVPKRACMKANTAQTTAPAETSSIADRSIAMRRVRLVAEANVPATLIWEPKLARSSGTPTTDEVLHRRPPPDALPADLEQTIIELLVRPLRADESHSIGNDNRERELRAIFAQLTPMQALQIRRRLEADRSDDLLATAFRRIVVERRQRLRAFLASPRRHLG